MIEITVTILHGLLICLPFSAFVYVTFRARPRLWLHSLPPDIQAMAPPKTEQEKKLTRYVLLPVFLLILPGLSVCSVLYLHSISNAGFSLSGILMHLYGIWIIVHLWDFIVIDCVFAWLTDPKNPPISGTESAGGWKDYRFHFRSFLRASVMSALFTVPAALILYLTLM